MSDSLPLHGLQPTRLLHPWDFPGKSAGVGCHCLLHNTGAPQYIRQTLTDIKGENDSNRIIEEDFNSPLTPMDRSSKQKIKHKS